MNNYYDTFIKPAYLYYFNKFSNAVNITNPAKRKYAELYDISDYKSLSLRVKLTTEEHNIRYIWKTNDNIDDDLLYPIINQLIRKHTEMITGYLKKNSVIVHSYSLPSTLDIGRLIGKNGTNIKYLQICIANRCKCIRFPYIKLDRVDNKLHIYFKHHYDFKIEELDSIINEYLTDFT